MKILVTGGAGFIGSHVVDRYVEAGHAVVVVDNLSSGKREYVHPRATFYPVDVVDERLAEVFERERPEVVNHHAAQASVSVSVKDPLFDARVNVLGSINVFQQCVRFGVQKVIAISSGGAVYGDVVGPPVSEAKSVQAGSPYAASKISMEYYLQFYRREYGLRYTVLRYANVYGPRQDPYGEAGVVSIFCEAMRSGRPPTIFGMREPGDGGCIRDYVYVGDVAQANVAALERGDHEAFNIGTGVETTTEGLFRTLARIAEFVDEPRQGPRRPGDLERSVLDIRKAEEMLRWRPSTFLEEGLQRTWDYFRD